MMSMAKAGYIDRDGNIVIAPHFDFAWPFREGLAVVFQSENEKYGYIGRNGEFVLPPVFDEADSFAEGVAAVEQDSKYRYINSSGETMIAGDFILARPFSEGFAVVTLGDQTRGYLARDGSVLKLYNDAACDRFSEGLAAVAEEVGKTGFIDSGGNYVIEPRFLSAGEFDGGVAEVSIQAEDGFRNWAVINKRAEVRQVPRAFWVSLFRQGLAQITLRAQHGESLELCGFIDREGEIVIDPIYEDTGFFREGRTSAQVDGRVGVIDCEGTWICKPSFDEVGFFSEGLAPFRVEDRWGYIDRDGDIVMNPVYEHAGSFAEGLAVVRIPGSGN